MMSPELLMFPGVPAVPPGRLERVWVNPRDFEKPLGIGKE
jgi:hypothetical protein